MNKCFCCCCFTELLEVRIKPELNDLWLTKGSQLKLDCVYTRPKTEQPQTFDFYINGLLIQDGSHGFSVMALPMVVGPENVISTITLTKNITDIYGLHIECKTETGHLESRIEVHFFSVSQTSDNLTDWTTSLNLQCVLEGVNPSEDVKIAWMRNGNSLTTDGKYTIDAENGILQIHNPVRADVGEYICEIIFYEGRIDEQRFLPQPLFVRDHTSPFIGDGTSPFIGDGTSSSVGDGTSPFVRDRTSPFVRDRTSPFIENGTSSSVGDGTSPSVGDRTSPIIGDGTSPKPTTVAPLNSASTYFWVTPMTSLYIVSFVKFVL